MLDPSRRHLALSGIAGLAAFLVLGSAPAAIAQQEITFPSLNEDGAKVFADRYVHAGETSRGTALLFHDQNSSVIEYAEIAPRLAALGFETVAVDLRTGSETENRTYASTVAQINTYDDGIPDAEGALAWARETLPDDPILLWGSGVSADMVIVMAANHPTGISGVLAFSPPSLLVYSDEAEAASKLTLPLFVSYATTPDNELATVSKIADATPPELLTLYTPEVGAHGVATLTESGNPEGWEANWAAVEAFLDQVAP